jgi:hypothetical protein
VVSQHPCTKNDQMLDEEVIWELLDKGMMSSFGFRSIFVWYGEAVHRFQHTFHHHIQVNGSGRRRWTIVLVSQEK